AFGGKTTWMVGAPGGGPRNTGRVYVYEGLSVEPRHEIDSDATGAALGAMFLAVPGDLDGDGTPDTYSSDFSNRAKGPSTGRVYVHSGRDGHPLLTLTGETAGEGFGTSPADAGDVDGDGRPDLIVGAWQYAGAAIAGGKAYLYSGRDGKPLATFTCRTPGDTFGFDAVGMGDVDGDGAVDLLITSGWSAVKGHHSGRVFLLSSGIRKAAAAGEASTNGLASPTGSEREVRASIELYRSGWLANDARRVLAVFSSDAVMLAPGQREPIAGTAAISRYWWPESGPPTRVTGFDLDLDEVVLSGDLAVARGHDRVVFVTGSPPGAPMTSHSHFLTVLKRASDGTWRIHLHTWLADPA
ncbi:MAG: SgcJ/EcaC family oxidoreductase, partial [Chloroflexi bacterium]|nr:SgcJ/EcaC family oxidoreductase [Chloroflexota bacterium]